MQPLTSAYRIFALALALLMFLTSTGFSVDMHHCNGEFKSFSLFGKAKSCHSDAKITCPHHKNMTAEKKDCCTNQTHTFRADRDLQQAQTVDFTLTGPLQNFVTTYILTFRKSQITSDENPVFARYRPPPLRRNIPVLFQSFLL